MYKLALGAVFKNEAQGLTEWIEHYRARGVDHIYLVNDGSTDDYVSVLKPYTDTGYVEVFESTWDRYKGRQRDIYTHYFLPRFKDTEWFIICDCDEFIWSPQDTDFPRLLQKHFSHMAVIQIIHTLFGSNGHKKQPASVVAGFTRRTVDSPSNSANEKCIYNTRFKYTYLNVHYPTFADPEDQKHRFTQFPDWWRMNHYCCQSRDFWDNIKCTRGDADQWRVRTSDDGFNEVDRNEVEDLELYKQNKRLGVIPAQSDGPIAFWSDGK